MLKRLPTLKEFILLQIGILSFLWILLPLILSSPRLTLPSYREIPSVHKKHYTTLDSKENAYIYLTSLTSFMNRLQEYEVQYHKNRKSDAAPMNFWTVEFDQQDKIWTARAINKESPHYEGFEITFDESKKVIAGPILKKFKSN